MKILTVLIINLIIQQSIAQLREPSQVYTSIQALDKTQFGQTIMDTIQVQLTANNPVSSLIDMLRSMENDLFKQQDLDDANLGDFQQQCDEDLSRLLDEVSVSNQRAAELQTELEQRTPVRDQKLSQQGRKQEFLNLIKQTQDNLNAKKSLKDAEWAEEKEQHNQAEAIIEQTKSLIQDAMEQGQTSLVQKSQNAVFLQISDQIASSLKQYNFKRKGWKSLFSGLAEMAHLIPSDNYAATQLVQICEDLIDQIANSRDIESKGYNDWVSEYQTSFDALDVRAGATQNEINSLEQEIQTLNQRIQMASNEKNDQTERATLKQTQHDEQETVCDDENFAYGKNRQERTDSRQIISNAIGLLQSNLKTFKQYIEVRQPRR